MAAALVGRDAIVTRTTAPSRHERACQTLISRRVAVARASKGTVGFRGSNLDRRRCIRRRTSPRTGGELGQKAARIKADCPPETSVSLRFSHRRWSTELPSWRLPSASRTNPQGFVNDELGEISERRLWEPLSNDPHRSWLTKMAVVRPATVAEPAFESKLDCRANGSLELRCTGCRLKCNPAKLPSVNVTCWLVALKTTRMLVYRP